MLLPLHAAVRVTAACPQPEPWLVIIVSDLAARAHGLRGADPGGLNAGVLAAGGVGDVVVGAV
jgi:hypothetical protein